MVRDNLGRTVLSQKPKCNAENCSEHPVEPARPAQEQFPESIKPGNQEPTERERQLHLQHLNQHSPEEESETWDQAEAASKDLPTHLRTFRSEEEHMLVKRTHQQLLHSGYYWGSMTMEKAHDKLTHTPTGTFLIRDSGQPDVFFTLSYQSSDGPTSVRVMLNKQQFSLHGSHKTFASLFTLLSFYCGPSCKLTVPLRKQKPELLKQLCRRAVVRTHGAENVNTLPGLSTHMKDYVQTYPYCM
ncbi:suppressor of cytokine signaling 1-like [Genypterus blacodes]|uniref:suppressor of cytokine signaling 1-like n=1 Tax=Genypterus blacodes TaxID=154954 RepID=UPI003F7578D2